MNLSVIQTELVACALCEADGQNPDADVPAGGDARMIKAWRTYETEARRFIIAAQALERWSSTLDLFRTLAPSDETFSPALQAN